MTVLLVVMDFILMLTVTISVGTSHFTITIVVPVAWPISYQRALIGRITQQVCVHLWSTYLLIISRMVQPQDQWQGCANIWPPARCHWWPAGQGVGRQEAKLAADWSACVGSSLCSDQDHLLVWKTEQRNPNIGPPAIGTESWLFSRDLQTHVWGYQGLTAAVKAWILGFSPGKGMLRTHTWGAWVICIFI